MLNIMSRFGMLLLITGGVVAATALAQAYGVSKKTVAQPPTHNVDFEFAWTITPDNTSENFGPIIIRRSLDDGPAAEAVSVETACEECSDLGLSQPQMTLIGGAEWSMYMEIVDVRLLTTKAKEVNGKMLQISLTIKEPGAESSTTKAVQLALRLGA